MNATPGTTLDELPSGARRAWTRMRDELQTILGDDLVAMWAYGSTIGADRPHRPADLDTHVVIRKRPDPDTAQRLNEARATISAEANVEFDVWFISVADAQRSEHPAHAFLEERRDTAWALHRRQWLDGRYVLIYGSPPEEIVPPPTWSEMEIDLDRELEHIERHVLEGDTDPYEASYGMLNGSRILYSLETRNASLSKREAGIWAMANLPERWHPALDAAFRAYDEQETVEDRQLLAAEMPALIAMVRERLPRTTAESDEGRPRWSGY